MPACLVTHRGRRLALVARAECVLIYACTTHPTKAGGYFLLLLLLLLLRLHVVVLDDDGTVPPCGLLLGPTDRPTDLRRWRG